MKQISKLGFQPNKINVGVETPTYDCRVANNDCSLRKGRIITLTRISMKLKFQELLPLPRGYKANQRTCELREPVCRMAEG